MVWRLSCSSILPVAAATTTKEEKTSRLLENNHNETHTHTYIQRSFQFSFIVFARYTDIYIHGILIEISRRLSSISNEFFLFLYLASSSDFLLLLVLVLLLPLVCVLFLAVVVFLRTDTHQAGSRISHFLFFFFSLSLFFFFDFVFSFVRLFFHPIHTIQVRTCITIHRLSSSSSSFSMPLFLPFSPSLSLSPFLSRYIYIMLIDDEHLLSHEISCFLITIKSNH